MDFRLNVFLSVAHNLNFSRAANELHISQPAISRHIKELEETYKIQFFDRSKGKIRLTPAGEILLKRAEEIAEKYKCLQEDLNSLTGTLSGELRIGASTTIAQYLLPPLIAQFISIYPDVHLSLLSGNTEQIEQMLEDLKIDIGLIEGYHRKPIFRYTGFQQDELVLVTNMGNKCKDEISIEELSLLPLLLRETGSGTLEVIEKDLAMHNKKISDMNILMQLGNTESIKLFLENNSSVYAIISIAAIAKELKNKSLKIIDIKGLEMSREFAFVINQGSQNMIRKRFVEFLHRKAKYI